jgi:hypothetical protein
MWPLRKKLRPNSVTSSGSPRPSAPTKRVATCSPQTVGYGSSITATADARNGSYGRARAPKTGGLRCPVCEVARRATHREHDAGEDAVRACGSRRRRSPAPTDGGDAEDVPPAITRAGFDLAALAATLQRDGAEAFARSWDELLVTLADRRAKLRAAS